jgi:hypothetical protein
LGRGEVYTRFGWGNLRKGDYLEDSGIDGRINIKIVLQEIGCEGRDWIDVNYLVGQGQVAGTCECGNESSGSIK